MQIQRTPAFKGSSMYQIQTNRSKQAVPFDDILGINEVINEETPTGTHISWFVNDSKKDGKEVIASITLPSVEEKKIQYSGTQKIANNEPATIINTLLNIYNSAQNDAEQRGVFE
jgi:hypothetical protein